MSPAMQGRGIDHLVLAVRDLDAAGRAYERLGFRVGGRNRHPWGTENRIVQFSNRTFLELITVGEGASIAPHGPRFFSFGAFVRDSLERREAIAMVVLRSEDAAADATGFEAAGIGAFDPFHFERSAKLPEGGEARVAFSLAFASDPGAPEAGCFVCEQRTPDAFWQSAAQIHSNGALGVTAVVMAAAEPAARGPFLSAFAGQPRPKETPLGLTFDLPGGRIECLSLRVASSRFRQPLADQSSPRFVGFHIATPDHDALSDRLKAAAIPFVRERGAMLVPPDAAFGVGLAFDFAE